MNNRTDLTVPLPEELNDKIEAELEYGDSKAGWIREAIRMRLEAEDEPEGPEGNPSDVAAD